MDGFEVLRARRIRRISQMRALRLLGLSTRSTLTDVELERLGVTEGWLERAVAAITGTPDLSPEPSKGYGLAIAQVRKAGRVSQARLAEALGLGHRNTLTDVESGAVELTEAWFSRAISAIESLKGKAVAVETAA
jgi:DNA-binding XRE family transcriptional regulator